MSKRPVGRCMLCKVRALLMPSKQRKQKIKELPEGAPMSAFPIFPRCHPPLPQWAKPVRRAVCLEEAMAPPSKRLPVGTDSTKIQPTSIAILRKPPPKPSTKAHHPNVATTPLKKRLADVAVFAIFRQMAALILQTQTNKTYEQQKSTIYKKSGFGKHSKPRHYRQYCNYFSTV